MKEAIGGPWGVTGGLWGGVGCQRGLKGGHRRPKSVKKVPISGAYSSALFLFKFGGHSEKSAAGNRHNGQHF